MATYGQEWPFFIDDFVWGRMEKLAVLRYVDPDKIDPAKNLISDD